MCAKIKHDKEFVSKRLIFWDGLRNVSTPCCPWRATLAVPPLRSPAGCPVPWSRTETVSQSSAFWGLFLFFSYTPFQFKLQKKTGSLNVTLRISFCIQASRVWEMICWALPQQVFACSYQSNVSAHTAVDKMNFASISSFQATQVNQKLCLCAILVVKACRRSGPAEEMLKMSEKSLLL